jgi:enoyl-CoA hydratase
VADPLVRCSIDTETAVATVTLDRPAKLNALTPAMLDELEVIARRIDGDTVVRAVILTAAGGRAFCVGADIHEWSALQPLDMWRRWVKRGHQVFDQWARLRQPVIAALNGPAFGGGLELAITADVRLAADHAEFALPEASIATCPGWSGSQRLVAQIGPGAVKWMAFSGRRIDAQEALRLGLVQQVMPAAELADAAAGLAAEIASKAPVSVQLTKQLIDAATGEGAAVTLEAMAGALAASTQDAREGLQSFRERRAPQYRGE